MEIRILGDFDFAREIISGVARLFSYGNGFGYASGILLALYFLFLILKHAHDSDRSPNPMKEFVFGIILFLLVGGGSTSAKFDVELISISDPSRFEVINDVPALAAVPAWLASNFLGVLREKMEDEFTPVTYSAERGADPLGALIRLYERKIPTSSFEGADEDYVRSMNEYMENCFLADQHLDRAAPTTTIADLKKIDMSKKNAFIDAIKVDYNGLYTNTYLGNNLRQYGEKYGERVTCNTAYDRLRRPVNQDENTSSSQELESIINNGEIDDHSVRAAMRMVAGAYSSDNSPYALQANLFLATLAQNGISQAGYASEANRMVFEGYTRSVAQKVGEASIFKKFMVPTTTVIETFSFYIAPILMMLAIMGGVGFGYITKYLGLVLYINLFSFVKVFVDVFTAISVERTFSDRQGTPLSFDSLPGAMEEVSSFLATSATLTTSIPLLAMFLLYGSAHTLAGAVKSMGGGSANGNVAAPEVGTVMNGGTAQVGNQTVQFDANSGSAVNGYANQSNNALGELSFSNSLNAAGGSQINASETAAKDASQQVVQSMEKLYQEGVKSIESSGASSGHNSANTAAWSAVRSMVQAIQTETGWSEGQAMSFLVNGGARGAYGASAEAKIESAESVLGWIAQKIAGVSADGKTGGSAELYLGTGFDYKNTDSETQSKALRAIENYTTNLQKSGQYAETKAALQNWNLSKDAGESQTYKDAVQASKAFKEAEQIARVSSDSVNSSIASNSTTTIGLANMAAAFDGHSYMQPKVYEKMAQSLNAMLANDSNGSVRNALEKAGFNINDEGGKPRVNAGDLAGRFNDLTQFKAGSGNALMDSINRMNTLLNENDNGNYQKAVADNRINSAIWGAVSDTLKESGMGETLYMPAANYSNALDKIATSAQNLSDYDAKKAELKDGSGVGHVTPELIQSEKPNTGQHFDNVRAKVSVANSELGQSGAMLQGQVNSGTVPILTENEVKQLNATGDRVQTSGLTNIGEYWDAAKGAYEGMGELIKGNVTTESFGDFSKQLMPNTSSSQDPQREQEMPNSKTVQERLDGFVDSFDTRTMSSHNFEQGLKAFGLPANSGGLNSPADQGDTGTKQGREVQVESNYRPESSQNGGELKEDVSASDRSFITTLDSASTKSEPVKVTFEGQELTYENGRFEGLRADDEISLGNSTYQLTNERLPDNDGQVQQVFKSGDGEARYMWNDSSGRMDMIQRD